MTALGAAFSQQYNDQRFHDVEMLRVPHVPQTAQHQTHIIITINHGAGEDMEAVRQYIDTVAMYDVALRHGPSFEDWKTHLGETT